MGIKRVAILGSTGSIGVNTLRVLEAFPRQFRVVALSALNNAPLLAKQVKQFRPRYVALDEKFHRDIRRRTSGCSYLLFDARRDLEILAALPEVDIVVLAIQGSAALRPFLAAIRSGKHIAPSNKEALVIAGSIVMKEAKKHNARIVPVDSEQSAIFQCLQGQDSSKAWKVYLTASGGPLRMMPKSRFSSVSVDTVLRHPRWQMGKKITVDSATLMNKGLEVLEAMWLFDLRAADIEVLIHPESVVHSMVAFCDGTVLAQLGVTDMRIPIQYALTYPQRFQTALPSMDFIRQRTLTFLKPDFKKFPALGLCYDVAKKDQTFASVLNASNEVAVEAFLREKISFSKIIRVVERVLARHRPCAAVTLENILGADSWAREEAQRLIAR